MTSARRLRATLCDAAARVGPDAGTLCEGWDVRDLVAHLVVRERRPDTAPGAVLPALARHTDTVRDRAATRPFEDLVEQLRHGPPVWSPTRLRRVDDVLNAVEFLVHLEDIERAQPGWRPAPAAPGTERLAWNAVRRFARLRYRAADGPVVLQAPGFGSSTAGPAGGTPTRVTGRPVELLLHVFGRTSAAQVSLTSG